MKGKIIIGVAVSILLMLLIAGCTEQKTEQETDQDTNNGTPLSPPPTDQGSIDHILVKAKDIESLYCEITTTSPLLPIDIVYFIWEKPPYMKLMYSMMGYQMTIIVRPDGTYIQQYDGTWIIDEAPDMPIKPFSEQSDEMMDLYELTVLGTDTYEGKDVTIVQYTFEQQGIETITKHWIWNDQGIPVKTEITTAVPGSAEPMVMTMLYDFSFEDIPDSVFDAPEVG